MDLPKMESTIFENKKEKIEKLAQLFPSIVKDGQVDFDELKGVFSDFQKVETEKYELTWAGKNQAKQKVDEIITGKTLRFLEGEGVNENSTENIYIEGDNLEVLKLIQNNYYNSVQMIYIDPPYNTGSDFVYKDDFKSGKREIEELEGHIVEGERMIINQNSMNRFHANWLNMIYPRLSVAKSLLKDDGVIFISIDDNEVHNLITVCNEIFGEKNKVATLVWEKKKKGSYLSNSVTNVKEYVLVYCKDFNKFKGLIGEINSSQETYPCINANNKREVRIIPPGIESKFKEADYFLEKGSIISDTTMNIKLLSDLVIKNNTLIKELIVEGNWRYSQEAMAEYALKKELYITRDLYLRRIVNEPRSKMLKDLLPRLGTSLDSKTELDLNNLFIDGWGSNEDADEEQRLLFGKQGLVSYPKPVKLLMKLIASLRNEKGIYLDFFSGSGTMAEAIMRLNALDKGNRKFILVQVMENLDENLKKVDSNTKKSIENAISFLDELQKPHFITEIGKERIRRSIEKIKQGDIDLNTVDLGFKVFRVCSTNIRWTHEALTEGQIAADEAEMSDKDKLDFMPGTKDIDVVYEVMLRQRDVPLSSSVELLSHIGPRTYMFADSYVVCLEEDITEELVEKLAAIDPLPIKYVLRDSAFGENISLKEETFRRLQLLVERNTGVSKKTYTVEFL